MDTEDNNNNAVKSVTPKKKIANDKDNLSAKMMAGLEGKDVCEKAKEVLADANKKTPPPSAEVLAGEYQGAAYWSKSVKAFKRTAAHQDDDDDNDISIHDVRTLRSLH